MVWHAPVAGPQANQRSVLLFSESRLASTYLRPCLSLNPQWRSLGPRTKVTNAALSVAHRKCSTEWSRLFPYYTSSSLCFVTFAVNRMGVSHKRSRLSQCGHPQYDDDFDDLAYGGVSSEIKLQI